MYGTINWLVGSMLVLKEVSKYSEAIEAKFQRLIVHLHDLMDDMIAIVDDLETMLENGSLSENELESIYHAFFPSGQDTDMHDVLDYVANLITKVEHPLAERLRELVSRFQRIAGLVYAWYHSKHGFSENVSIDEI